MTISRRTVLLSTAAAACASAVPALASAAATATPDSRLFSDDFSNGFSAEGPNARWAFLPFGPAVGHDGVTTTSRHGLQVVSSATNPKTRRPAFKVTLGQNDPSGLAGTLDHVKWLVYANKQSSNGILGFDATPGYELSCETTISGTAYGTERHPFGAAVVNPNDDLRIAAVGLPIQDLESGVAFDFFLTNESVYVFYERLPHNRPTLGNYAAFLYTIPVARRKPDDEHRVKISYDRSRGLARWFLDGREVFRVDRIGCRLPSRRHMMLDHGGVEQRVAPRQLACGMGMFNILDGALPGRAGSGLVRLTTAPQHYFDPVTGEPTPQRFLDNASLKSNRLFGQGADLRVRDFVVSSRRAG
jgi:hypothetical protein